MHRGKSRSKKCSQTHTPPFPKSLIVQQGYTSIHFQGASLKSNLDARPYHNRLKTSKQSKPIAYFLGGLPSKFPHCVDDTRCSHVSGTYILIRPDALKNSSLSKSRSRQREPLCTSIRDPSLLTFSLCKSQRRFPPSLANRLLLGTARRSSHVLGVHLHATLKQQGWELGVVAHGGVFASAVDFEE